MNTDAVGMAVRVIGTAVLRQLVVDRPLGVIVYGRDLADRELRWLIDGMGATQETDLATPGPHGEAVEIAGTVLGRVYRLRLTRIRWAEFRGLLHASAGA